MKRPNLLVIISLISFLSIILITGSPFKSSTNSFDNTNPILLEILPIQAQDDGDDLEGDGGVDDFAGFEEEDDNDNGEENEEDTGQFSFESEDTEDQETDEVMLIMFAALSQMGKYQQAIFMPFFHQNMDLAK